MNTDLHKMFEEAANDFADKHGFRVPYDGSNNFYDITDVKASKDGFLAGAKYGYKEAIEFAKEWIAIKGIFNGNTCGELKQYLADFETYMNKLWEEKK